MGKKKTSQKKAAVQTPLVSADERLSAPALPDHLVQELALHTQDATPEVVQAKRSGTSTTAESDTPAETDVDEATNAAVDAIIREEGDQVLADIDADTADAEVAAENPKKRGFWRSIGHFFAAWWGNKLARGITIFVLLAGIAAVAAIPTSRYFVLNTAGVRSTSSVKVIDNTTRLPLKNVAVSVGSQKAVTNSDGIARVHDIKLGEQTLTIKRIAFAEISQRVTIGWGSNPLGEFLLDATGVQYQIVAKDYVSGKPILDAEAALGEAVARADSEGVITLTLEDVQSPTLDVIVSAPNYRSEARTITTDTKAVNDVVLTPSARTVFVGYQNGRYDVISMFVDGKDRRVELPGTGRENKNIGLVTNANGTQIAVVSTRDDVRDDDGFLLSTLTILDVTKGTRQVVSHAEHIQLIDWSTNNLVFVETSAGSSAANPDRYRIISYDLASNKRTQIASANQFNSIVQMQGLLYYAVSSTDPDADAALFSVKLDGTGRQKVFNQEVWTLLRTGYDTLMLQSPDSWYTYTFAQKPVKSNPPISYQNRRYEAPQQNVSLWVDVRAGESVLHAYDTQAKKDTEVKAQPGLNYPIRWLSKDHAVYRVVTNQEVADYVLDVKSGATRKITDVTAAYGFSN